jgi:hypothetical protein
MELSHLPSLQDPLQEKIHPNIKYDIISRLWPGEEWEQQDRDFDPFLSYYTQQCKHAVHDRGKHILVRKHQHILNITDQFRELQPREDIKSNLKHLFTTQSDREVEILNNSVDLAARLYLMMSIGDNKYAFSSGTSETWDEGNLKDFLSLYFNDPQRLSNSGIKFEKSFNAYNLGRIAGIRVKWTNNLMDHLRMIDADDRTVEVFHHVSFLKHVKHQLFPPGLLDETLRTLSLLFPPHDPDTEKFFQTVDSNTVLDKQLGLCAPLRLTERQIVNFDFWHDRLIMLKQAFDQSRPATLSQWWYDRRNGVQWYTFWIAIVVLFLTIFFGMAQTILSAMQVYKAYHPTVPPY